LPQRLAGYREEPGVPPLCLRYTRATTGVQTPVAAASRV
jgi:hypothetical protein